MSFKSPAYEIINGKICYYDDKKQMYSNSISYGYKTAFAYLDAAENWFITKEIAKANLKIQLKCGKFILSNIIT